jgi:ectoine hydroxylase-related dioxygenase (phytanoyl-CoA dioxygenase family)
MNLQELGYCYFNKKVNTDWIDRLKEASLRAISVHQKIQIKAKGEVFIDGMALNSIVSDNVFIDFLDELFDIGLFEFIEKEYFESKFILNSFSSINNSYNKSNFSNNVHRDIKFYSGDTPLMLNAILMLDDFTEQNGATLVLPKSHKRKLQPSDGYFQDNCIKVLGEAGTIFLFNSNVWHSSSPNKTDKDRAAIAMTFSKSSIKQLLDYPAAIDLQKALELNDRTKQLLGYYSRVPITIEEWYSPNRTYKKGQD